MAPVVTGLPSNTDQINQHPARSDYDHKDNYIPKLVHRKPEIFNDRYKNQVFLSTTILSWDQKGIPV